MISFIISVGLFTIGAIAVLVIGLFAIQLIILFVQWMTLNKALIIMSVIVVSGLTVREVMADAVPYYGVYMSSEVSTTSQQDINTNTNNSNEVVLFGGRSSGNVGISSDVYITRSGGGLSFGGFVSHNDFRFNSGLAYVSDSETYVYNNERGVKPVTSNTDGLGAYIGLDYKILSIRITRYTANHKFTNGYYKKIGHNRVKYLYDEVNKTITRNMVWVGATFNF